MSIASPAAVEENRDRIAPALSLATRGHIPALDGLRGLAIVLVLICHFSHLFIPTTGREKAMMELVGLTRHGVDLFFVLSGFLITGILYDSKTKTHYFRNFYGRRTVRIFPLYYLALLIWVVILPQFLPSNDAVLQWGLNSQWSLWLYCSNLLMAYHGTWIFFSQWFDLTHFWSLAVEEQFYLVWPFLIFPLVRGAIMRVCVILMVAAIGFRLTLLHAGAKDLAIFVDTPCRIDALALGGLIAMLGRGTGGLNTWKKAAWVAGPVSLVALGVGMVLNRRFPLLVPTVKYTFFGMMFGSLLTLIVCARPGAMLHRIFTHRALLLLGKYSYGIYVFHCALIPFFVMAMPPEKLARMLGSQFVSVLLIFIVGSLVSIGVAYLSWHLYEKHWLKLKKYFI